MNCDGVYLHTLEAKLARGVSQPMCESFLKQAAHPKSLIVHVP